MQTSVEFPDTARPSEGFMLKAALKAMMDCGKNPSLPYKILGRCHSFFGRFVASIYASLSEPRKLVPLPMTVS
jgi:hypothetical protein